MTTGGTVRSNLQDLAKRGDAKARANLAAHPLPRVFSWLYEEVFRFLDPWRGTGGFGAAPLTLADVREYEARFGVSLMPGELDVIKQLDVLTFAST